MFQSGCCCFVIFNHQMSNITEENKELDPYKGQVTFDRKPRDHNVEKDGGFPFDIGSIHAQNCRTLVYL